MDIVYLDVETCGFAGIMVMVQYAINDGEVVIHDVFRHTVGENRRLIEKLMNSNICGFNLVFDLFHINKLYNCLMLLQDGDLTTPKAIAAVEKSAREANFCCKPRSCLDLMLYARKGPYQSTMNRSDVRIRRVPRDLVPSLITALNSQVNLREIYFANFKKERSEYWTIRETSNPQLVDLVLKFKPSASLKSLAKDALGDTDVKLFKDVTLKVKVNELQYAPFHEAVKNGWPTVIDQYLDFYHNNEEFRKYAYGDIDKTRRLYNFFGKPSMGDTDSELTGCVAACRWQGFTIDRPRMQELHDKLVNLKTNIPIAPRAAWDFLSPHMTDEQRLICNRSTAKQVLKKLVKSKTKVAPYAEKVLRARVADKEIELYKKLLLAERFHAGFNVIGALSGRMSGSNKLNAQGIKGTEEVRSCFTLAWPGYVLSGGDFRSFEMVIAAAFYADPRLIADLKSGRKIHADFGTLLFPDYSYKEIIDTEGTENDRYRKSKEGVFALLYGGTEKTLEYNIGVTEDISKKAFITFNDEMYPRIGQGRRDIMQALAAMTQPKGPGSAIFWKDPEVNYVESMLGFRRYFELELMIQKALFNIAMNPPKDWVKYEGQIRRSQRDQTIRGAGQSAIFATAFQLQAEILRAAMNHKIQSTGAGINKEVQRAIWDEQPFGCHPFQVAEFNVHDEIQVVNKNYKRVKDIVFNKVEEYRPIIPLIEINWAEQMNNWSEK